MDKSFESRIMKNNQYYNLHFEKVRERTEKRDYKYLLDRFLGMLPNNTCILDIGCGTGEHLNYFHERSYQAYGIEPSEHMRNYCLNRGLLVMDGCFENIHEAIKPIEQEIGGIWCAASLLHVPEELFERTVQSLYSILDDQGVFFFTLRLGNGYISDQFDSEHVEAERFIQLYTEDFLEKIIRKIGFKRKLKLIEESYWGRKVEWISYILSK